MKTIVIKNVDSVDHTYAGQLIIAGESYTVQDEQERQKFCIDQSLNQHIWDATAKVVINDGNADLSASDGDAWLKGQSTEPKDSDGAPLTRTKITQSGWHFQLNAVEFETSKLNSVYNKDDSENDLGFASIKFYDASGTELVAGTQVELDSSCVKTVVDWEPDHDVEVIGGFFEQASAPSSSVRMWIVAIPDLPVALGGSVPFVQGGLNLRCVSSNIEIDGKTPKLMPYSATYHTNKFRITLIHDAGFNHPAMIIFKIFRLNV